MTTQDKKPYEKPTFEPVSIFGADTTTCCRATNQTCSQAQRVGLGKSQKTSTTS